MIHWSVPLATHLLLFQGHGHCTILRRPLNESRKVDNAIHVKNELLSNRMMDVTHCCMVEAHQIEATSSAEAAPFDGYISGRGP
jgi:hypothetical protein